MWKKIWEYITFKPQNEGETSNFNLKMMHKINRISLLMFLIGIIFLTIKLLTK